MDIDATELLEEIVSKTDGRDEIGVCLVCSSGGDHDRDCAYTLARMALFGQEEAAARRMTDVERRS